MTTATSTILFVDMVGSTALRTGLGEDAADRLFRAHQRSLGEVVGAHLGRVVSNIGGLPGAPAVEIVSEALAWLGDEDSPLRTRLQSSLARALALAGRNDEAQQLGVRALAAARVHDDPEVLAAALESTVARDAIWPCCLSFLAEVCVALTDRDRAEVLYRELEAFRGQTLTVGFTICLGPAERLMGSLAALTGRPRDAEEHFRAALELAERAGSPVWQAHVQHDWAVAFGDRPDLLAAAGATATELGMDALAQRCRLQPARGAEPVAPALPDGLSGREVEVLRLVAAGCSNREIGERLFISQNTAANHIRSILQKTSSANRAEAAAYAARHGLLAP